MFATANVSLIFCRNSYLFYKRDMSGLTHNPDNVKIFPFLDLPAELRNLVYRYTVGNNNETSWVQATHPNLALVDHMLVDDYNALFLDQKRDGVVFADDLKPDEITPELASTLAPFYNPAIMQASRQIYSETVSLFYSNEFGFNTWADLFLRFSSPENLECIRRIKVLLWLLGTGESTLFYCSNPSSN